jgi:hypothetical protein
MVYGVHGLLVDPRDHKLSRADKKRCRRRCAARGEPAHTCRMIGRSARPHHPKPRRSSVLVYAQHGIASHRIASHRIACVCVGTE